MDNMLQGIPHVICYIDDILVTGSNNGEHLHNLARVFERLSHHGFHLKKEKCEFLKDCVEFLGHKIDDEGLTLYLTRLKQLQVHQNLRILRSFAHSLVY